MNRVHPASKSSKQGMAESASATLRTRLNSDIQVWESSSSIENILISPLIFPQFSLRVEKWLLIIPGIETEKENEPEQMQIRGLP